MDISQVVLAIAVVVTLSGMSALGLMFRYLRRSEPGREGPKF
jgi:hypothetical protein